MASSRKALAADGTIHPAAATSPGANAGISYMLPSEMGANDTIGIGGGEGAGMGENGGWMGLQRLRAVYDASEYFTDPFYNDRYNQNPTDPEESASAAEAVASGTVSRVPEEEGVADAEPRPEDYRPTWRLKERLKTTGVALVLCLNLGTDPPNTVKPNPCSRKECWFDPTNVPKQKGIEIIGNALQQQYEKLQSKSKYKQCLDPTSDDLRRVCINLRKQARSDRLLMHYNGHGVPRPTPNGELWTFGKNYTYYMPVSIIDIRSWFGDPSIYVIDCSGAGILLPYFFESCSPEVPPPPPRQGHMMMDGDPKTQQVGPDGQLIDDQSTSIVLAACRADETLPTDPLYPADIFTSCLTTPITIACRWFMIQNPHSMGEINLELSENIPGKESERKTPRGELYWIFTAITDTIAWSILPQDMFQKLFRQDLLVASLFRNFLFAKRMMKSLHCNPVSNPPLPDCSAHPLWHAWDLALESSLIQISDQMKGVLYTEPQASPWYMDVAAYGNASMAAAAGASGGGQGGQMGSALASLSAPFFSDMLTAFEIWLDFGGGSIAPGFNANDGDFSSPSFPVYLPVVLQILLSQTYRGRALQLLLRYISRGPWAVNAALLVGIYPYILKLLPSSTMEMRQVLIAIWTQIISFDPSCRLDLVKDKYQAYFIQSLCAREFPIIFRCISAYVLCEICSSSREGQQLCLASSLHKTLNQLITMPDVLGSQQLRRWVVLCLGKLCKDFTLAKYMFLTELGYNQFVPLLSDPCPVVRAAVVAALGEVFGASDGNINQASSHISASGHSLLSARGNLSSSSLNTPFSTDSPRSMNPPPIGVRPNGLAFSGGPQFGTPAATPATTSANAAAEQHVLRQMEIQLAMYIVERLNDGSVHVRREAIIALSKISLLPVHWPIVKHIAKKVMLYHMKVFGAEAPPSTPAASTEKASTDRRPPASSPIPLKDAKAPSADGAAANTAAPMQPPTKPPKSLLQFPWILPGPDTQILLSEVKGLLTDQGALAHLTAEAISMSAVSTPSQVGAFGSYRQQAVGVEAARQRALSREGPGEGDAVDPSAAGAAGPTPDQVANNALTTLATSYLRLWLSLREIQYKDPHPKVSKTVAALISYIHAQMDLSSASSDRPTILEKGSEHSVSSVQSTGSNHTSNGKPNLRVEVVPPLALSPGSVNGIDGFRDGSASSASSIPLNDPIIKSSIYCFCRKIFLQPDTSMEDADVLSLKSQAALYRERKLDSGMRLAHRVSMKYKSADDNSNSRYKNEVYSTRSTEEGGTPTSDNGSPSLPQSLCNFQPKAVITVKNSEMTSHVLFHGFKDILAICDGESVGVWSLGNGSRVVSIDKNHWKSLNTTSHYCGSSSSKTNGGSEKVNSSLWTNNARITSLNWLNTSSDSLLMTAADDGTIRLWRDDVDDQSSDGGISDSLAPGSASVATPSSSAPADSITPSLATAFIALPDIAASSRGSGVVTDWQQHSGVLAVGGNSETIRLWDVAKEQCSRVLYTGMAKCTTSISTQSVSYNKFSAAENANDYNRMAQMMNQERSDTPSHWTWLFAGFGDGSVSVYDQRVPANGGRVHAAREDNHWIVHVQIREDIPEVITGALYGGVKFWDLRTMRVFKTIEVHKSPLTAMALHNCAPIIASGSHKQFIKILTFGGEQLSMIRYHDGFLGQRIAPVSCLSFHPHKMLLAAGSTDQIVALYAPTETF